MRKKHIPALVASLVALHSAFAFATASYSSAGRLATAIADLDTDSKIDTTTSGNWTTGVTAQSAYGGYVDATINSCSISNSSFYSRGSVDQYEVADGKSFQHSAEGTFTATAASATGFSIDYYSAASYLRNGYSVVELTLREETSNTVVFTYFHYDDVETGDTYSPGNLATLIVGHQYSWEFNYYSYFGTDYGFNTGYWEVGFWY